MIGRVTCVCALAALPAITLAEGHSVAARAGMLGLGVEYTYALKDRIGLRAGLNGAKLGFSAEEGGLSYDFDFIWDSLSFAVDFHPFNGPWRLTAGAMNNDNGMEAVSSSTDDVTVGGTSYTPAEVGTLRADVSFDGTSSFIGMGWDWSRKNRFFGLSFDIGLLDQGAPQVAFTADGGLVGDPQFQADLMREAAELEDDLDSFDLMPYASLGFVFRF